MRDIVARMFQVSGYEIHRANPYPVGRSPFRDAKYVLGEERRPVVFDVGANTGQTLEEVLRQWPLAYVHCFEPSVQAFGELQRNAAGIADVWVNQVAFGASPGRRAFHEYEGSTMHSFLMPGADYAGSPVRSDEVQIDTIDNYCAQRSIERIDVLKCDTQGFDLEVMKGAAGMIGDGKVTMILVELNFGEFYRGQATAGQLIDHLLASNYLPMCFYPMIYRDGRGLWCDGMFLHRSRALPEPA